MHVGYSILDLNIKGPWRGHIIKVTQLQILVKPNCASGLTLHKTQLCAAPRFVLDVGSGAATFVPDCALGFSSGQTGLLGAEEADLGQQEGRFIILLLYQQAWWIYLSPDRSPVPPSPVSVL